MRTRSLGTLLAALVIAGCGGGGHPSDAAGPGPSSSAGADAVAVWRQFAACVRAHGLPNLPDPVLDEHGDADFGAGNGALKGALTTGSPLDRACAAILHRLPASAKQVRPPTAAELQQEVLFARCMRAHGLPDWPDPSPDGTFALPPRLKHKDKVALRPQLVACQRYNSKGGNG